MSFFTLRIRIFSHHAWVRVPDRPRMRPCLSNRANSHVIQRPSGGVACPTSDWLEARRGNVPNEVGLLAARMQHDAVRRVTLKGNDPVETLAPGQRHGGVTEPPAKMMRGEAAMTLRHLAT